MLSYKWYIQRRSRAPAARRAGQTQITAGARFLYQTMTKLKPSSDPIIGKVLNERYRILELMGVGKFSVVYRAHHLFMDRTVALKTLKFELVEDERIVKRFEKEAIVLSKLRHPNIVTVFDCFVHTTGQPFLVMDFLDGISLEELIRNKGPVPARLVKPIMVQASAGLSHAHQNGILHRDVKPENIVLLPKEKVEERVRLLDFGFALVDGDMTRLTKSGTACGSPAYMSPERWRGQEMDVRSDIYSLGICMYEALTGQVPFQGKSLEELREQHVNKDPAPVADVRRELAKDTELQHIIDRALAKDPELRFSSMREFQAHLKRWQPVADQREESYLAGNMPFATRPKEGERSASQVLLMSSASLLEESGEELRRSSDRGEIQGEVVKVIEHHEHNDKPAAPDLSNVVECETQFLKAADMPLPPLPEPPPEKQKIVPEVDRRKKSNTGNELQPVQSGEQKPAQPQAQNENAPQEAPASVLPRASALPPPPPLPPSLPPARPLANSAKAVMPAPPPHPVPGSLAKPAGEPSPLTKLASELSENASSEGKPARSPMSGILSPQLSTEPATPAKAANPSPGQPSNATQPEAAKDAQQSIASDNTIKLEPERPASHWYVHPSDYGAPQDDSAPTAPQPHAASGEWHPLPGNANVVPPPPPVPSVPKKENQQEQGKTTKSGIVARVEAALSNRAPEGDGLYPHEMAQGKELIVDDASKTRVPPPKSKARIGPSYLDRQIDEQQQTHPREKRSAAGGRGMFQSMLVPLTAIVAVLIGISLVVGVIMLRKAQTPTHEVTEVRPAESVPAGTSRSESDTPKASSTESRPTEAPPVSQANSQPDRPPESASKTEDGANSSALTIEPRVQPEVKKPPRRKVKRRKPQPQSHGGYIEVPATPRRRAYQTY